MPQVLGDRVVDRFFRRPSGFVARRWWRDPRPHHAIFTDVLGAARLTPDDRLLEVGCGGGTFLQWALRSGCSAAAVDHSLDMVTVATAANQEAISAGRLELRTAPGEHLPFPDGRFTCATLMNVFFFVDARACAAELYRVLAPGGRLVLHTLAPDAPSSAAPPPLARRMTRFDDGALEALVAEAGFAGIDVARRGDGELQLLTAGRTRTH